MNVSGTQTRKIECFWSNKKCQGYKNKPETQDFCNGGDVYATFKYKWGQTKLQCKSVNVTRTFICEKKNSDNFGSYEMCKRKIVENVKYCDQQQKRWTKVTIEPDTSEETPLYYR